MRVKSPRRQRHNKILKLAKGYRMSRSKHYKAAHEAVLHAGQYAYNGRKLRRRDMRSQWIMTINAGLSQISDQLSYSQFMNALKKNNITLDRKTLSTLAQKDFETFKYVVESAK